MESALYSIYALVFFVSEISLVRFLIQKRVHKYRTPTLSTKYSLYVTLHRILMLKVKARARHAFTLKQKNLF